MTSRDSVPSDTLGAALRAGVVQSLSPEGVRVSIEGSESVLCRVLQASELPLVLREGDRVLCWNDGGDLPVVLGRTRRGRAPGEPDATPDTLVLEATDNLTLRCGDGSITIRKDGKILIKGKDLVSHAQRANRIRGGSVAIN